ncbi:MAG: hypothetical protein KIT75_03425 [Planctomycetota bacterium]|nr:hypothetical protein [Planctomycetota bacterium]
MNHNHKAGGPRVADLACPICGGRYVRPKFKPTPDGLADARILASRLENAADRIEAGPTALRDVGPVLAELGQLLASIGAKRGALRLVADRQGGAA